MGEISRWGNQLVEVDAVVGVVGVLDDDDDDDDVDGVEEVGVVGVELVLDGVVEELLVCAVRAIRVIDWLVLAPDALATVKVKVCLESEHEKGIEKLGPLPGPAAVGADE